LAGALYLGNDGNNIYLERDNNYDLSLVQNGDSNRALYLASAGNVYVNIDSNNNDTDKAFIVQNNALKAGTELFRVSETGNVGIGTSIPNNKLDIFGGTGTTLNMSNVDDGNRGGKLTFISSSATGRQFYVGTNSSIYNLVFGIDSIEKARIDTNGNLGIGITSPTVRLHVSGSSIITNPNPGANSAVLLVQDEGTATTVKDGTTLRVVNNGSAADFSVFEASSAASNFVILNNGNVGIGTTAPAYKLDVSGDLRISGSSSTVGTFKSSASSCFISLIDSSNDNVFLGNDDGDFLIQTPTTSYSTKLIVKDDGNVGIGTTLPASRLHVDKSSQTLGSSTPSGATIISNLAGGNAILELGVDTTNLSYIQSRNVTDQTYYKLLLNPSGGSVGIGTTSPAAKLQVAGNISGSSFTSSISNAVGFLGTASWAQNVVTASYLVPTNSYTITNLTASNISVSGTSSFGYVGIGTTNPTYKLDLQPTSSVARFGQATVGAFPANSSVFAFFGHTNLDNINTAANYALLQSSNGDTFLNASSGRNVYFRIANSDKMLLNSSGQVSIGTTVPVTGFLDVRSNVTKSVVGPTNIAFFGSSDGGNPLGLAINHESSSGVKMIGLVGTEYGLSGNNIKINETLHVQYTGNVGLNTITPNSKLSINGSPTSDNTFTYLMNLLNTDSTITAGMGSGISFGSNINSGGGNNIAHLCGIIGIKENATSGNYASALTFWTRINGAASAERVRIDSSGNVGIGTTSPATKLDVKGNIFVANAANGNNTIAFGNIGGLGPLNGAPDNLTGSAFLVVSSSTASGAPSHMKFFTTTGGTCGERMRIDESGNIGMGTIAPNAKLQVVGNISGTSFTSSISNAVGFLGTSSWAQNVVSSSFATTAQTANALNASNSYTIAGLTNNGTLSQQGTLSMGSGYQILATTGTSPIPGIAFVGDTNTGIYSPGADTIGFSISGSERVRITSGGNVGIGTTNPNSKLEVAGTAGTAIVSVNNTSVNRSGSFGIDNSGVYIQNSNNGDYFDLKNASGTARFRVIYDNATHLTTNFVSIGNLSATGSKLSVFGNLSVGSTYGSTAASTNGAIIEGNVGIGTTSAVSPLTLNTSTTTSTTVGAKENRLFFINNSVTADNGAEIVIGAADTNTGRYASIGTDIKSNSLGNAIGDVYIATKALTSDTTLTKRFVVQRDGNVGIGTTNPVATLQVAGNISGSSFTSSVSNAVGFLGTASWAQNVVSASFATTAQTANALNASNTYTIAGLTSAYVDVNGSGTIPTTGIYRPSTKTLGLSADGTLIFKISNVSAPATSSIETGNFLVQTGNVGIGTTNPTDKLTVYGALASYKTGADTIQTQVYLANGGNTRAFNIQLNSGGTGLDLWSYNSANAWLRHTTFDYDGRVGIGTAAPVAKFEISGSSNSALMNIKSPISGAILYVSGSGAVGIGTSNVGAFTLQVNGSFGATTKSFIIDHPTKAGKKLMYGSLESPYHGIRLTGRDTLVNGKCKIQLPDYMYKLILHDSVNIQLTGIKCNKTLYVDEINIPENYFTIAYDKAIFESYKDYDFFWDFTAIRADVPELITEL
jgi:uncharacterized protein (DUF2132 family)